MPKNCPACAMEVSESKKSSAWIPLVTAVGVSAAAILVFRQVRKSRGGKGVDRIVNSCSRAASDLERRISESFAALAG